MWKTNMPTELSADEPPVSSWPLGVRCRMLLWNCFPLLHICVVIACGWHVSVPIAVMALYLFPPLLCRMILWFRPLVAGSYQPGSPEFVIWWATAQTQMLFCRLPVL